MSNRSSCPRAPTASPARRPINRRCHQSLLHVPNKKYCTANMYTTNASRRSRYCFVGRKNTSSCRLHEILPITVYGGSSAEWRVSGSDILRWRRRAGGGSVIKLSRFCPQHRLCLSITALCRSLCTVGKVQFVLEKSRRTKKIVLDCRVATNFTFITHRWNLGGEK